MTKLEWHFASTDGGEVCGINDPVMNHFQGRAEYYVAREGIQNALDARRDYETPVRVQFEVLEVRRSDLPDLARYVSCLNAAEDFTQAEGKAKRFFTGAHVVLGEDTVQVCRIGDYNTTGLTGGQDDPAGSWFKLVRAVGSNSQSGVGGGSHGFGKGAPFAASALRMVFYSSMDEAGQARFQGKVRLASFVEDEDIKRNVGDLGVKRLRGAGVTAAEGRSNIPHPFARDSIGTDVFVVGIRQSATDWALAIRQAVLENFWAAIHFRDLEVEFVHNGECLESITSDSLARNLEKEGSESPGRPYYDAVINPSHTFTKELDSVGEVSLYLRLAPGTPQRIQMMRKSKMKVWNRRFYALVAPYSGVFLCHSDRGNRILREMEPPKHDKWDPNLDPDQGRKALAEVTNWITECLTSVREAMVSNPEDLPGLEDLLPISASLDHHDLLWGDGSDDAGSDADESAYESGVTDTFPLKEAPARKRTVNMTSGHGPGTGRGKGPRRSMPTERKRGPGAGTAEGEDESQLNFRCVEEVIEGRRHYRASIAATTDIEGVLKIRAIGEDVSELMKLASVRDENGHDVPLDGAGIPDFSIRAGQERHLTITLESPRRYILEASI